MFARPEGSAVFGRRGHVSVSVESIGAAANRLAIWQRADRRLPLNPGRHRRRFEQCL